MKMRVCYDRVVLWDKPGGTRYVTFLYKGDIVEILEGYSYDERTWEDKRFIKVKSPKGYVGFVLANAIADLKSKWKGWPVHEETNNGEKESSV